MNILKQNIYQVGTKHWDRKYFDELIPLPDGTSYNAYLIKGSEKTALLDTVDPDTTHGLIDNLVNAGVDHIDYLIAQHAEQDHSGSIPDILLLYPDAKVVTNPKCKDMLIDLLNIDPEKFITIEDGQTLSLGDKSLRFIYTPWVHWPETFCTYLIQDRILFSCDFFGAHLAESSLFVEQPHQVRDAAKRYYAEIMMPFRLPIRKNLDKLSAFPIDMIAPSHGPVYDEPNLIIDAYKQWVSDDVQNTVVLPYISMHNSTKQMVEHFIDALSQRNINVKPFDLLEPDIGKIAMALVDAATIVIASPTVLAGAHPKAAYAALLVNALRPKTKFVSLIGSFGWSPAMQKQITSLIPNLKAELIEPVMVKGLPADENLIELDRLADDILQKHKQLNIVK